MLTDNIIYYRNKMDKVRKIIDNSFAWSERYVRTDTRYVAEGSFWIILGKGLISLLSAVTMIAFAKFASKETFGSYQYVITVIGLLSVLSLPGMNMALVRSIALGYESSAHQAYKTKLRWGLLVSLCLVAVSFWYLSHGNPLLGYSFLLGAALSPLKDNYETYLYFWNGKKRFGVRLIYDTAIAAFTTVGTVTALIVHAPLVIIIFVFLTTRVIVHAIAALYIKKHIGKTEEDPHIISYGKQLTTTNGLTQLIFSIDKLLIWYILGPAAVAIYVFSMNPIKIIQGLIPVGQIALPKLSHKKNISKKELFRKSLILFWVIVPLSAALFIAAPLIYKVAFDQYIGAIKYFRAFILIILFIPFSLLQTYLIATKRAQALLRIRTTTLVVRFASFIILIPLLGMWGAVIAAIVANTVSSLMVIYYFIKVPVIVSS